MKLNIKNIQFKFAVKILISLGILAALVMHMDTNALKEAVHHFKASAWLYALLFIVAQIFLLSLRWMYLINVGRHRMNYAESVQVTLASLVANILFITTVSGIVVRVAMAYHYGASFLKSIFATAIDRLTTLAALLLLCAIGLPALANYVEAPLFKDLSLYIGLLILFVFALSPLIVMAISRHIPTFKMSENSVRSGQRYLTSLIHNNSLLGKILATSLAAQLCFFASVFCIAYSADISLSFWQIMTVLPAIALVSSMPFSFGGWGVREGAFIYGLGILGVPMETAFSISIQVGLISLLATALAAVPTLITTDFAALREKHALAKAQSNHKE